MLHFLDGNFRAVLSGLLFLSFPFQSVELIMVVLQCFLKLLLRVHAFIGSLASLEVPHFEPLGLEQEVPLLDLVDQTDGIGCSLRLELAAVLLSLLEENLNRVDGLFGFLVDFYS